ncbi:hypothetical protein GYMLUDRAFT_43068 [Collybiopsis luxurians FD-317 M1]|uniref:Rhodopsin domain-containing protein n=1 Tax=Collybiopsis luxurians FD-317 M1 TaxID=944289 RepID=A0A0D0CYQ6_9AGAR|nr:hypothetical protein GYMLUDRAFT_43068 [Collybiopsis luxurians FD-317 M1]
MLSDLHVSTKANRVFGIVLLVIVLCTIAARICIRYLNRRLWWDDICALLTTLITTLLIIADFLTDGQISPTPSQSRQLRIVQNWIIVVTYSSAIWSARMSLILSIIRLIPPFFTLRKISEVTSVVFVFMWMGTLIPKIYICASDLSWYTIPNPTCSLGNTELAIGELITYVAADIMLIFIPLRLLYHVTLVKSKRRMLIIMFSANLFNTVISVIHAVFLIDSALYLLFIVTKTEVGMALILANLAILTPYIYRLVNLEGDFDSEPCTHYRSVQPDGGIRMRRVSDLVPDIPSSNAPSSTTVCFPKPEPQVAPANASPVNSIRSKDTQSGLSHHGSSFSCNPGVITGSEEH